MSENKLLNTDVYTLNDLVSLQNQINSTISERQKESILNQNFVRPLKNQFVVKVGTVDPKHVKKRLFTDYKSCMFGISMGNARMEDAKLEACIRWIGENFSHCKLVLGDSIYRHTLRATKSVDKDEALSLALQMGSDFMTKYSPMIERYSDICKFEWEPMSKVEQHSNFESYHDTYKKLYQENEEFQILVNESSGKYLSGAFDMDALSLKEKEEKILITVQYFLEESAIFSCLCDEDKNVLIYPGTIKPLQIISSGQIDGVPQAIHKLIQIRINLKKKGKRLLRDYNETNFEEVKPIYNHELINNLKGDLWEKFLPYTEKKNHRAGDIIALKGMTNRDIYVLTKGVIEILTGDLDSGSLNHLFYSKDVSIINDRIFFDGSPRATHIAALTDCETLFISSKSFLKMMRSCPEVASILLKDMASVLATRIMDSRGQIYNQLS